MHLKASHHTKGFTFQNKQIFIEATSKTNQHVNEKALYFHISIRKKIPKQHIKKTANKTKHKHK